MKLERDPNPIKSLEVSINSLIPVSANLTRHQSDVIHPDTNTKVWFRWRECFKIPETIDYDQKPVEFTTTLVYTSVKKMSKCFNELAYILTNIDDNWPKWTLDSEGLRWKRERGRKLEEGMEDYLNCSQCLELRDNSTVWLIDVAIWLEEERVSYAVLS